MSKFVVYTSALNGEVVVTTKKNEANCITEAFGPLSGRDINDFDRAERKDTSVIVTLNAHLAVS